MLIESIINHLDKKEQIFNLLKQLTIAVSLKESRFREIILNLPKNHYIFVCIVKDTVIGMITMFLEQKLIHNGACVLHIEDLVVDKNYRGRGIAEALLEYCMTQISLDKYYKIILNCSKELIPFYEKKGFKEKNVQMSKYLS